MRHPLGLLLLVFLTMISCAEETELQFESQSLNGEICPDCPKVVIKIPQVVGQSKRADNINNVLKEEVIAVLNFDSDKEVATLEEAMTSFKEQNQSLNRQFKDEKGKWEADIKGEVRYQNDELFCVRMNCYTDTGGAHGFAYSSWFVFELGRGNLLMKEELFSDLTGFMEIAESAFREKEGLKKNESLAKAGLFFDGDTFRLPENIGVMEDGLLLYYNQGEVSSYIDGPIEIKLPYKELKSVLNPEYFLLL